MIFSSYKSIRKLYSLLTLLLICAGASAQFNGPGPQSAGALNQPQPVTVDQSLLNPAPRDYVLQQGDTISIHVFEQVEYSPIAVIGTDGNVSLPLIGIVSLDHMQVSKAEDLIADRLRSAGIYNNPQVTINVTAGPGATATVIGESHALVTILGSRSLLSVLAAAGGLPKTASHVITINRPGVPEPIVVDLGTDPSRSMQANVPIFPGDTIVVARVGVIYLLGSFHTQGQIELTTSTPLTLIEATALAGGPTFVAKLGDLRLIRTVGNKRTVVKLNMKRVEFGKDPDPILQPNDILFLPDSFLKGLLSNGQLGSALGITSVLLSTVLYIRGF